jgi:hypothetical protein
MTHPDPFAPADSDQHPANFRVAPRGQEQAAPVDQDAMVPWLVLDDEPVAMDNPDAATIGQARWEEYRELLNEYGTPEQIDRLNVKTPLLPDEDMPKLAELREKHGVATASLEGVTADVKASATPDAASDLEAKLAALKDAGL